MKWSYYFIKTKESEIHFMSLGNLIIKPACILISLRLLRIELTMSDPNLSNELPK